MKKHFYSPLFALGLTSFLTFNAGAVEVFASTTNLQFSNFGVVWSGDRHHHVSGAPTATLQVSTTVQLDVAQQQIRVFGSTPASSFVTGAEHSFQESFITGYTTPGFPNPPIPQPIYQTFDHQMAMTISGTLPGFSFDTGFRPFAWDGLRFAFDVQLDLNLLVDVEASYTLTTAGQTQTGSQSFQMNFQSLAIQTWGMKVDGYPSSLAVYPSGASLVGEAFAKPMASATLPDGSKQNLLLVPEPTSAGLIGLSAVLLGSLRRRRNR
jgi:hypothetical protein